MIPSVFGIDQILEKLAGAFDLETLSLGGPRWRADRIPSSPNDSCIIESFWWSLVTSADSKSSLCLAAVSTNCWHRAVCCSSDASQGAPEPADILESDDVVAQALRNLDCFPARATLKTGFDDGVTYLISANTWTIHAQLFVHLAAAEETVGIARAINLFARNLLIRHGTRLDDFERILAQARG